MYFLGESGTSSEVQMRGKLLHTGVLGSVCVWISLLLAVQKFPCLEALLHSCLLSPSDLLED